MNKWWRHSVLIGACIAFIFCLSVAYMPDTVYGEDEDIVMVSLGDSYSSGEGIEPFYGSREATKDEESTAARDWLAHRSQYAWSGMLKFTKDGKTMSKMKGKRWYFVAASGAETIHFKDPQEKKYKRGALLTRKALLPPQKDVFEAVRNNGQKVGYVTITIGGNDLGFSDIVTFAVTHVTYGARSGEESALEKELNKALYRFEHGVNKDIQRVYEDIAEEAGKDARIIVAGYPPLIAEDGGEQGILDSDEAALIKTKVREFNKGLKGIVEECDDEINISFVSVDGEKNFEGHEAYAEDPYINPIMNNQKEELKKGLVSAYSIHPNIKGAVVYAGNVQAEIDRLEKEKPLVTARATTAKPETISLYVSEPDGYANVRTGRGTDYDIAGRFDNGTKVTVYDLKDGWYRIYEGDYKGNYISESTLVKNYKKEDDTAMFDETTWMWYRGPTLGGQTYVLFHKDGSFSQYYTASDELEWNSGSWRYNNGYLYMTEEDGLRFPYADNQEYSSDGESFVSTEQYETMSGMENFGLDQNESLHRYFQ